MNYVHVAHQLRWLAKAIQICSRQIGQARTRGKRTPSCGAYRRATLEQCREQLP